MGGDVFLMQEKKQSRINFQEMYQLGTQLNNSSAYGYASFKDRTMQANSSLYPNESHY